MRRFPIFLLSCAALAVPAIAWAASATGNLAITVTAPTSSPTLPLVAWAGGPAYWAKFAGSNNPTWTSPNFFPIGIWSETAGFSSVNCPNSSNPAPDTTCDKAAGINFYQPYNGNSVLANIRAAGMWGAISCENGAPSGYGSETIGVFLGDEIDMQFGAGSGAATRTGTCSTGIYATPGGSGNAGNGYTVMSLFKAANPVIGAYGANFGKSVLFPGWESDALSSPFVNGGSGSATLQFISVDTYWYTDPDACQPSQGGSLPLRGITPGVTTLTAIGCHRSSNYGAIVDRLTHLMNYASAPLQPIFTMVELVGQCCSSGTTYNINGPQVQGAVMSGIIHGAMGIVYFGANPGASENPCYGDYHLQRDNCNGTVPAMATINADLKTLASILNTQSYGWTFNPSVDTMLKKDASGNWYIFAEQGFSQTTTSGTYTFTLPSGMTTASSATVICGSDSGDTTTCPSGTRTVTISGGAFSDSFAKDYSWHIYKIPPS